MKRILPPLVLLLNGCQSVPETFAPPEQRPPLPEFRPYRATRVVHMSDPDAAAFLVRDIGGLEGGSWRWAGKRPTLRLRPRSDEGIRYVIDFTLPPVTFKETGPVTISFYFGDHLLESVRYAEAGRKQFQKLVPARWIATGEEVLVAAEIDRLWKSKEDGSTLGFIITSMGLAKSSQEVRP